MRMGLSQAGNHQKNNGLIRGITVFSCLQVNNLHHYDGKSGRRDLQIDLKSYMSVVWVCFLSRQGDNLCQRPICGGVSEIKNSCITEPDGSAVRTTKTVSKLSAPRRDMTSAGAAEHRGLRSSQSIADPPTTKETTAPPRLNCRVESDCAWYYNAIRDGDGT